ncbi:hypothetical protein K469DRAFT_683378 [Zopfia rhizophila CBS 207.26]|uniref:Uncharacterized protein n=1 Tax=Zopfia rhizophila CBS 207.26 TaxID=1314779 RepID=A0A6A6D9X2_9PEZI|nr:hypothetical protein K469DRAFT_683378 [Zopfia rhizophila CBS 207.26]
MLPSSTIGSFEIGGWARRKVSLPEFPASRVYSSSPSFFLRTRLSFCNQPVLQDAGTGAALQKFKGHTVIQTMSFSDDGIFLLTDQGMLCTTSLSSSEALSQRNLYTEYLLKNSGITFVIVAEM